MTPRTGIVLLPLLILLQPCGIAQAKFLDWTHIADLPPVGKQTEFQRSSPRLARLLSSTLAFRIASRC